MLNGTFKGLWNKAVLFMGILWAALVFMIWESGQLVTSFDRQIFLAVVVIGFLIIYVSGFYVEARHRKKRAEG